MSSSITNPVTFTGSSSFSSSFDQVLQRAVSIAALPLQQMQNAVYNFQGQQAALSSLQANFSSVQYALQSVANATTGSMMANVSNGAVVKASAASNAMAGTYTIEVEDKGSSTTTISAAGPSPVTDPATQNISSSNSFTLTINGTAHAIVPSSNNLIGLANTINSGGFGVQATVVNLGSNTSPDYRLAVTSNNLGADTIQLNDGSSNLLTVLNSGTDAQYKVNGNPTVIHSTSSTVTLAPGLTADILSAAPGSPVTITVTNNDSALSNALSGLVTAYNNAFDALSQHRGQNGGMLAGQSVIFSLGQSLSQISQYAGGSGQVQSLTEVGLTVDASGHLSFDQTQFNSLDASAVQKFLGGISTGGFLQSASNSLKGVADPTDGALATQISTIQDEITAQNDKIADEQSRITSLQASLQARLTAADAAIAVLEHQKTMFADMFAAQYLSNSSSSSSAGGTIG